MQAYLFNTETNDRVDLQYTPLQLTLAGVQSRYVSAEVPQTHNSPFYYQGSDIQPQSLQFLLNSPTVQATIEKVTSWAKPTLNQLAPAIVVLQIGALKPVRGVITDVTAVVEMIAFNAAEKPTRATVSITIKPIY